MRVRLNATTFYREEAERLRAAARATSDADVRADLLTLAVRYDELAELPEDPDGSSSGDTER